MVDNLAEKVDVCALNWDHSTVYVQLGLRKLSVILWSSRGGLLSRSCLSIEVSGKTVRTFRISVIFWVSAVERCPFRQGSTVFLINMVQPPPPPPPRKQ